METSMEKEKELFLKCFTGANNYCYYMLILSSEMNWIPSRIISLDVTIGIRPPKKKA